MPRAPRPKYSEPSQAFSGTYGSSKEKLLLEAKGIAIMFNEDGSVVIEAFDRQRRIGIRVSPEDAKSHAPDFRRWSVIR